MLTLFEECVILVVALVPDEREDFLQVGPVLGLRQFLEVEAKFEELLLEVEDIILGSVDVVRVQDLRYRLRPFED